MAHPVNASARLALLLGSLLAAAGPVAAHVRLVSPNGGESFGSGCTEQVTWEVGGGSVAATVDIQLSDNGGNSFSDLDAGTANDGMTDVNLPCTATTSGRIRAQAVGNIFFDISDDDFTIADIAPAEPPFIPEAAIQAPAKPLRVL